MLRTILILVFALSVFSLADSVREQSKEAIAVTEKCIETLRLMKQREVNRINTLNNLRNGQNVICDQNQFLRELATASECVATIDLLIEQAESCKKDAMSLMRLDEMQLFSLQAILFRRWGEFQKNTADIGLLSNSTIVLLNRIDQKLANLGIVP